MPFRRLRWSPETLTCGVRGHVTPAATVARLRPEDAGLGIELPDGRRLARCLRCDVWLESDAPAHPENDVLPALDELAVPRRGKELRDVIVLRTIAVERSLHFLFFAVVAVLLTFVELRLPGIESHLHAIDQSLDDAITDAGGNPSGDVVARELDRLVRLRPGTLRLLILTDIGYLTLGGVEAVGLWLLQRWAEYLTVVATSAFVPLELYALSQSVTVIRLAVLCLNLLVIAYLVWAKRLFGLRGGANAGAPVIDHAVLFGPPAGAPAASRLQTGQP